MTLFTPITLSVNGEEKPLRLTLGALAEIEDALGGDLESLKERLANPRIADILTILNALLRGGGAALSIEALKAADVDLAEAATAIAKSFDMLGGASPGKPQTGTSVAGASVVGPPSGEGV